MECRKAREDLSAYLDGELPPQERQAVRGHVQACEACVRELRALQATADLVRALPRVGAPAGLAERICGRLEGAEPVTVRRRWVRVLWPALAAAGIGIAFFLFSPGVAPERPTAERAPGPAFAMKGPAEQYAAEPPAMRAAEERGSEGGPVAPALAPREKAVKEMPAVAVKDVLKAVPGEKAEAAARAARPSGELSKKAPGGPSTAAMAPPPAAAEPATEEAGRPMAMETKVRIAPADEEALKLDREVATARAPASRKEISRPALPAAPAVPAAPAPWKAAEAAAKAPEKPAAEVAQVVEAGGAAAAPAETRNLEVVVADVAAARGVIVDLVGKAGAKLQQKGAPGEAGDGGVIRFVSSEKQYAALLKEWDARGYKVRPLGAPRAAGARAEGAQRGSDAGGSPLRMPEPRRMRTDADAAKAEAEAASAALREEGARFDRVQAPAAPEARPPVKESSFLVTVRLVPTRAASTAPAATP